MSQNVVTQRLVNATNILFHLMDLQPYALVLPMDSKTAARTKRKILQKILGNHREPVGKNASADDGPADAGANDDTLAGAGRRRSEPTGEGGSAGASGDSGRPSAQKSADGTFEAAEAAPGMKIAPTEATASGDAAGSSAPALDLELPVDDVNSPFFTVNRIMERLDSEDMKGCIIMLASRKESSQGVVPLAGGIIEIYDEHERSIQAVWVNRSLEQRANLKILLKTLVLRIFAHAYQIHLPEKRYSKSNKLVSIYQSMLVTFPRECVSFIEKEMLLSKHYEAFGFNEPHNDNPKVPCRCHKISPEASELFYGISESRFNNLYTNLYEKLLFESIGKMTPIVQMYPSGSFNNAEKIDQISKAVREIERSLREQGTQKRSRKA